MDLTGSFFSRLRTLVVTLERQSEQLKQAFHGDETEFEDDSPMRYLHELSSEIRTLKNEANNILTKSSEERDGTYDFIKASKILMNRNATDLGKTKELFEKYGYKPISREAATKDEAKTDSESSKSDREEQKNLNCPETRSGIDSLIQTPQLSDFGLSKYIVPSTWNTTHILPPAHIQKEEPKEDCPGCLPTKVEQLCMNGRDLCLDDVTACLTEDQTIFLLNKSKKSRQANKMNGPSVVLPSKDNLTTPGKKNKVCDYDHMASPAVPTFCTPGLKVPSRKNITLLKPSDDSHSDASKCTDDVTHPDCRPLRKEPEQAHVTQTISNHNFIEEAAAPVLPSDRYGECLKTPVPRAVSHDGNILTMPTPAPEITVIPTQILQLLSKHNSNIEPPGLAEKANNEGIAAPFQRRPALGRGNKENSSH